MILEITSEKKMKELGVHIGTFLLGGETVELIGDVGAGKTTLVKGIAVGLGITENVSSPSFMISRIYDGHDDIKLAHYDFYRLQDAGLMNEELAETLLNSKMVTIIEWGGVVSEILPIDKLSIRINAKTEDSRQVEIKAGGIISQELLNKL